MTTKQHFTLDQAAGVAAKLGINFQRVKFKLESFRRGMDVELEHGLVNPTTNVTNDDSILTGKIALAHLTEFPDYYERLDEMEKAAEEFWASQKK